MLGPGRSRLGDRSEHSDPLDRALSLGSLAVPAVPAVTLGSLETEVTNCIKRGSGGREISLWKTHWLPLTLTAMGARTATQACAQAGD